MADDPEKKKSELTEDELNRYWDAYSASVRTQIVAKEKLQIIEDSTMDLGERSGYRADRLRVEANAELLEAKRIAFDAANAKVNPPSDADVGQVRALATSVAEETADRNRAKAILGAATTAMTKFSQIQPKP